MKKEKCFICEKIGYLANHFECDIDGVVHTAHICARCFEIQYPVIKELWEEIYLSEKDLVGLS